MDDYIKIHRRLQDWRWYKEPGMLALWVHILLSATKRGNEWEMRTSASKIASSIGVDLNTVRTGLSRLKRSGAIAVSSSNQCTIITVLNYDKYQSGEPPSDTLFKVEPTIVEKPKPKPEPKDMDAVERIYKLYPTKCPIKRTSTGKCSKDKVRIATLLKSRTEEDITRAIKAYLKDCADDGRFIKNFSTLLNNLPETEAKADYPELNFHEKSLNALDIVGDW